MIRNVLEIEADSEAEAEAIFRKALGINENDHEVSVVKVPDDYVPRAMSRVDELVLLAHLPGWAITPVFRDAIEAADDEKAWEFIEDRRRIVAATDEASLHGTTRCMDTSPEALAKAIRELEEDARHVVFGVIEVCDPAGKQIGWSILSGPR